MELFSSLINEQTIIILWRKPLRGLAVDSPFSHAPMLAGWRMYPGTGTA